MKVQEFCLKVKDDPLAFAKILTYLILFFTVISSGSLIGYSIGNKYIYLLIYLLELVVFLLYTRPLHIDIKIFGLMLMLLVMSFIQSIVYIDGFFRFARLVVSVIMHLLFLQTIINKIDFFVFFERIIRILLIINLSMYLLCSVTNLLGYYMTESYDWLGTYENYFYLYYYNTNVQVLRNSGIFWEPGVWQIFLNAGLLVCLFRRKNKNILLIALYVIAILTTVSTTGIILMLFIFGYFFYVKEKKYYEKIVGILFGIIFIFATIYLIMLKKNVYTESFDVRLQDLLAGISLVKRHILFGCGYLNNQPYLAIRELRTGNTNGLIEWFYQTGIMGITFFFYPFAYLNIKRRSKKFLALFLMLVLMIINFSEPIFSFSFNLMLIACSYAICFQAMDKCRKSILMGNKLN